MVKTDNRQLYYAVVNSPLRILGSMHFFPAGVPSAMPGRVHAALAAAEEVWLEHKMDPTVLRLAPGDPPPSSILPVDLWAALEENMPAGFKLDEFQPWALGLVFGAARLHRQEGVEALLLRGLGNRPLQYLETHVDLSEGLKAVPMADLVASLYRAVEQCAQAQQMFERQYEAWAGGDPERMFDVLRDSPIGSISSIWTAVFEARNRRWAERIRREIIPSGRRALLVVGALHLAGPGNLLASLRTHGLETVQLA
ncbi:TraB/GumN family protein [Variovorax paradoxus]|nr:TraB/GumN family protein [Variovorax paradoxus]